MANTKPTKSTSLPTTSKPTRIIKGMREFEHDLFKLKVAPMKRNISWKYYEPDIRQIEHCHIYHSCDEKGKPQQYCAPVGGHFHKIEVDWSEFGTDKSGPKVTVGPALQYKHVKLRGAGRRMVKRIVPVSFYGEDKNSGEELSIKDTHTHEVEYLDTEILSQAKRMKSRPEERTKVEALMDKEHRATQSVALLTKQNATPPTPLVQTDKSDASV